MKIDKNGYKLTSADNILTAMEKNLQKNFGSDFYIKPEGVIDNIAFAVAMMEIDLQNQIAFLAKQFDPETAEDIWQDALYQRIGLTRLAEKPTVFTKKIKGTVGYSGKSNTIFIKSVFSG